MSSKINPSTGNVIRTDKNKFVLPDGTTAETLEVVIVDFVSKNTYYEGAYDKDAIVPPNCFAIHPDTKGMVPSANSPDKQCDDCTSYCRRRVSYLLFRGLQGFYRFQLIRFSAGLSCREHAGGSIRIGVEPSMELRVSDSDQP